MKKNLYCLVANGEVRTIKSSLTPKQNNLYVVLMFYVLVLRLSYRLIIVISF